MARWRLTQNHYLNVPGTEWEYKETDQATGRQGRKIYHVPRYLDLNDPSDHTPRGSGQIVVCYEGKGQATDIVFEGPPTFEMEPMDAEAEAITAQWKPRWARHPIESLPVNFSQSLIDEFEGQMAAVPNTPVVSQEEFAALQAQVKVLMEQNKALQQKPGRRV